jgi:hypothetical protein
MIERLGRLGDKMLSRLVARTTARAAWCWEEHRPCGLVWCCKDDRGVTYCPC